MEDAIEKIMHQMSPPFSPPKRSKTKKNNSTMTMQWVNAHCTESKSVKADVQPAGCALPSQTAEFRADAPCIKPANVYCDHKELLRAIQGDFLNNVDPRESGLLDELRAVDAISSDEEQRVEAEKTRRDKARKLFCTMGSTSPQLFGDKCMPILNKIYPHVLSGKRFDWKQQNELEKCLRHAFERRVSQRRLADDLHELNCCSLTQYEQLFESQNSEVWEKIFDIIKRNCANKLLMNRIQKLINKLGIVHPMQFDHLVAKGFPCTCQERQPTLLPKCTKQCSSLDDGASSASDYPASSISDRRCDTESDVTSDCSMIGELRDEDEASETWEPFGVQADKRQYGAVLSKINQAQVTASCIKPLYRNLEKITDDIFFLVSRAEDEIPLHRDASDLKKFDNLRRKALGLCRKIQQLYEVSIRIQKLVSGERISPTCVSQSHQLILTKKKRKLLSEIQEAHHFLSGSKKIKKKIITFVSIARHAGTTDLD